MKTLKAYTPTAINADTIAAQQFCMAEGYDYEQQEVGTPGLNENVQRELIEAGRGITHVTFKIGDELVPAPFNETVIREKLEALEE